MSLGYVRVLMFLAWAFVAGIYANLQAAGFPAWRANVIVFPLLGMLCVFAWWDGDRRESARKANMSSAAKLPSAKDEHDDQQNRAAKPEDRLGKPETGTDPLQAVGDYCQYHDGND